MKQEKRSHFLDEAWKKALNEAEGKPYFFKQCLYIPDRFEKPMSTGSLINTNDHKPLAIEYCSGNGQWIVEASKQRPELHWIAVERDFQRARKIWKKIQREEIENLFLVFGEAFIWTKLWVKEASIQEAWVNFPDPWPKRRHAKNRLIQEPFEREMARVLQTNGTLTLVTDDAAYSQQMLNVFQGWNRSETEQMSYGNSYFHTLWQSLGKKIDYHRFTHE